MLAVIDQDLLQSASPLTPGGRRVRYGGGLGAATTGFSPRLRAIALVLALAGFWIIGGGSPLYAQNLGGEYSTIADPKAEDPKTEDPKTEDSNNEDPWVEAPRAELQEVILNWEKLIPDGTYDWIPEDPQPELLDNPEFWEKLALADRATSPQLDNTSIALAGFMVPLDLEGKRVRRFLLVPQAGQCIHVPPPPVNQTILVTVEEPVEIRDLYEPVEVKGTIRIESKILENENILRAESGYHLAANTVSDFEIEGFNPFGVVPGADGDQ